MVPLTGSCQMASQVFLCLEFMKRMIAKYDLVQSLHSHIA